MLTAKAYNGRVILEWVARCMADLAKQRPEDQRYALLASCACLGSYDVFPNMHTCWIVVHVHSLRFDGGCKVSCSYFWYLHVCCWLCLRGQGARFLGLSERCGRVLGEQSARDIYNAGYKFAKRYLALSLDATRLDQYSCPRVQIHWQCACSNFDLHISVQAWGRWVSLASKSPCR